MFKQQMIAKFVLGLLVLCSSEVMSWWNDAWPYRVPITIDASTTGAAVIENQKNATVLIKLHSGNFGDFFLTKEDLSDLRFIANDDKTPLKYHVERFDIINQLIYVWVKVPQIAGGVSTERIWMYYGNMEAVRAEDAGTTYDDLTAGIFHFADTRNGVTDSSAYGSNASSFTGEPSENSLIGGGVRFNGNQQLLLNSMPAFQSPQSKGLTFSTWVRPSGMQDDAVIVEHPSTQGTLVVALQSNNIYASITNGAVIETPKVPAVSADNWHFIVVAIAAETLTLYVDGKAVASSPVSVSLGEGPWSLGSASDLSRGFSGELDVVRVDNVVRSADWVRLANANQGMTSKLLAVQPGEQLGSAGGGSGFFFVIFTSTEESGWTIIGLLMLMAAVSWIVMAGKTIYLRKVGQDNSGFLEQYRKISGQDPVLLDHEDTEEDLELEDSPIVQAIFGDHNHFQSSPIYRLYHRGAEEVKGRIGNAVGSQASGLNPSAVNAIKASLDAQMVREIQRLNSKMVLLTIAISGGPFLGLLGTVVGVMITFAAIAATGDVNISAIAPGVAAALLTTVAGLVVAIPALFGYNWLATRIKENVADMRVFCDEYITRIAEYYGDH